MNYLTFSSPFDSITIIWKGKEPEIRLQRIFLSDFERSSEEKALKDFKLINKGTSSSITSLRDKMQRFLKGEDVKFDLGLLNFNICYEIQDNVLQAEYQIPRGWVSTYKRIAEHIGIHNGARVVGNSLARNPFPIVIPCHRAIKTNGELGGFQGGVNMKRSLLELEGIEFSDKGKVITNRIFF